MKLSRLMLAICRGGGPASSGWLFGSSQSWQKAGLLQAGCPLACCAATYAFSSAASPCSCCCIGSLAPASALQGIQQPQAWMTEHNRASVAGLLSLQSACSATTLPARRRHSCLTWQLLQSMLAWSR